MVSLSTLFYILVIIGIRKQARVRAMVLTSGPSTAIRENTAQKTAVTEVTVFRSCTWLTSGLLEKDIVARFF